MKKWHLIIDVAKCEDCNNCFLSCKDEFVDNVFAGYARAQPRHGHRWIDIMRKERGQGPLMDVAYLPVPCQHCDNAPCIRKAANKAVYKRDDGIVIIDPQNSVGQRGIVDACPYGAIWWNDEENVPQKCNFCAHLLDQEWKEPRCVQACPTGALRVIRSEDAEMRQIIGTEKLEVYRPDYQTRPRVYYKNLFRYTRCFIAGSVAVNAGGRSDCAEGARVALMKESAKIDGVVTDNYGDFKFDNIRANSGTYRVEIFLPGHEKKIVPVDLKASVYLGDVYL